MYKLEYDPSTERNKMQKIKFDPEVLASGTYGRKRLGLKGHHNEKPFTHVFEHTGGKYMYSKHAQPTKEYEQLWKYNQQTKQIYSQNGHYLTFVNDKDGEDLITTTKSNPKDPKQQWNLIAGTTVTRSKTAGSGKPQRRRRKKSKKSL